MQPFDLNTGQAISRDVWHVTITVHLQCK